MRQLTLPLFDPAVRPDDRFSQTPASPRHATPNRVARLGGQPVSYELRRSRRRTIGLAVDDTGLRVTAPRWASLADIDAALLEKERWILRKLVEWRDHAKRRERLLVRWEDGAELTLLGQRIVMRVDPQVRGAHLLDDTLHLGLPADADGDAIGHAARTWLQGHARGIFSERLALYCPRLGVKPSRWRLSSARTRWGSCAADGSIRLNWRLVHFPIDIVDYVIVHELAHLKEMNHGPRFWATVASLLPHYETARQQLKEFPDDLTMS